MLLCRSGIVDAEDEVGGAAAFAGVGEDAFDFGFAIFFGDLEAVVGVLEGGNVYVWFAYSDVSTW